MRDCRFDVIHELGEVCGPFFVCTAASWALVVLVLVTHAVV